MKYYVQEIAKNYLRNLTSEPDLIDVHPHYLHGLDISEFTGGFLTLHRLVRSMYTDIISDPGDFGMPLIEAVDENPKSVEYTKSHDGFKRVPHLLLILGAFGSVDVDLTLSIGGVDLIAAAKKMKIVKMPELLEKLTNYGFVVSGYVKTVKDGDVLSVGYPDCRALIAALKSMAEAQRSIGKGKLEHSNTFFYMMMPEILASQPATEPILRFENMYSALNAHNRDVAKVFDDCVVGKTKSKFKTLDFMRNRWTGSYTGVKSKKALLTMRAEQDNLIVKLNLESINDYMGVVMGLPEQLRVDIRDNAWPCNKESCNPKCVGGFVFDMDGKTYNKCRGGAFSFTNVSDDDAAHLRTLLELEMAARREVS